MKSVDTIPSKIQFDIILGNILGDGCLEFNGYIGTRLQIKQSIKYKDYVFWLYSNLSNLCISKPKQRQDTGQWYFSTRALKELTHLHSLFYKEKNKVIPNNISDLLISPLSLAVWYMDDGSLDYRPKYHYSFKLATNSFSLADNQKLVSVLGINFGVESTIHTPLCRGRRYPELYVGVSGRNKFVSTIRPYILDCFSHKLPSFC